MAVAYERMVDQRGSVQKMGGASSLADVLNVILDKGIVIDAWVRLSVIGIEILTLEARVVVASVETYLRYAEAIGLTELASAPPEQQGASGRRSGQGGKSEQNGHRQLSEDQVMGYLEDHPDGSRLGELQAYFDAPRDQVRQIVDGLVDKDKVHKDEKGKTYMPADKSGKE